MNFITVMNLLIKNNNTNSNNNSEEDYGDVNSQQPQQYVNTTAVSKNVNTRGDK